MERQPNDRPGRPGRGEPETIGEDDQEFASVEDLGPEPSESPAIDDV